MSKIESEVTAAVWKIEKSVGDAVEPGETVMILESMKMEIPVEAEESGTLTALHVSEGDAVDDGQLLAEITE